jgi:hypothetical protein
MIWRESEKRSQHREYPWTLGSMQIYGSYKYRRDFIEAVKCPGSLSRTRPLKARVVCCHSGCAAQHMVSVPCGGGWRPRAALTIASRLSWTVGDTSLLWCAGS